MFGVFSGSLLVSAFLGPSVGRVIDTYGGRGVLALSNLVLAVGLVLLAIAPTFWFALACLIFSGFAMIVFGMSANTKVQEDVPDALRGRVMAIYSMLTLGTSKRSTWFKRISSA